MQEVTESRETGPRIRAVDKAEQVLSDVETPTVLRGRRLTKSYGMTTVLQGVDVALQPGEVLAVCCENGAGKSTLRRS